MDGNGMTGAGAGGVAGTARRTEPPVQHKVVDIRATGVVPGMVAEHVERALDQWGAEGWDLKMIQPIIYNSSTTGYLLLIFERPLAVAVQDG